MTNYTVYTGITWFIQGGGRPPGTPQGGMPPGKGPPGPPNGGIPTGGIPLGGPPKGGTLPIIPPRGHEGEKKKMLNKK